MTESRWNLVISRARVEELNQDNQDMARQIVELNQELELKGIYSTQIFPTIYNSGS